MSKTILLVPDQHAAPGHSNERADWLANLTIDLKPDIVVNGGDGADMESLSMYDKGKRSFVGKSYKADIEAHNEFQDRWWGPVRATKKKLPSRRVYLIGNHEQRIDRALDLSPELTGTVGYHDLNLEDNYQEIVYYDGGLPGVIEIEGILFAHFFPTGISGRPMGGERPAHMLIAKNSTSCVAFHQHTLDFASRRTVKGQVINGLVAGCYQDYTPSWAGPIGKFWQAGVCVLRNVENGNFDFQWISLESLKKAYSNSKEVVIEIEEV